MAKYKIGFGTLSKRPYLKIPNKYNTCIRLFDTSRSDGWPMDNKFLAWNTNVGEDRGVDFTLEHLKLIDEEVLDLPLVKQHLKAAIEECLNDNP